MRAAPDLDRVDDRVKLQKHPAALGAEVKPLEVHAPTLLRLYRKTARHAVLSPQRMRHVLNLGRNARRPPSSVEQFPNRRP